MRSSLSGVVRSGCLGAGVILSEARQEQQLLCASAAAGTRMKMEAETSVYGWYGCSLPLDVHTNRKTLVSTSIFIVDGRVCVPWRENRRVGCLGSGTSVFVTCM